MKLSTELKLRLINVFCQGYFFALVFLTLIVGFNITLPFLCADDLQRLFYFKTFAVFIFVSTFANYIYIRLAARYSLFKLNPKRDNDFLFDSFQRGLNNGNNNLIAGANLYSMTGFDHKLTGNGKNVISGDTAEIDIGGWTYCKDCCELAPPRTKHCPLCKTCILKRDHHCFFAGCCIGFHNQRYFTIFCMYGAIGGTYSTLVTHYYQWYHYEGLQNWGVPAYFLPPLLWFWFVGSASGFVVIMTLFLYWNCLTAFICFYYFVLQLFLVYRGQTKYECMKGIYTYKGYFWLNVKSVFGPLWFLGFIIPVPYFAYYGNGKDWDEFVPCKML